jgi:capping protein alpha
MADDAAPPELPPREATPPELPPRESVEALSLAEEDVADLDAAAEDEGYEEEAADAAEALPEAPLTEEEEEARGVAQHLLLNAPPGEFTELLDDVAALTPERALEGGFVAGVARARNAQILEAAITEDGARVVLCREAEVTPTTFRDATGKLYDVDHATLRAVPGEDVYEDDAPESLQKARDELQKVLSVYASTRYLGEGHASTLIVGDALKCVVRGARKNLGNFHSGSWASAWTLTPSGDGYDVQGMIQVRAHYFEDGNVQLYATKEVTASNVIDVALLVEEKENALHAGLEAMYGDMADSTFKALRRVMPITKLKMKWSVDALRLKGGLTKAAAEV